MPLPEDLILREATAADAEALSSLGSESFVATFGHLYSARDLQTFLDKTHSPRAVAAELAAPGRVYRLAESGGALAGYAKLVLACGWPDHARGHAVVEMRHLYTAPALTGHGIGTVLMDWALAEARARGADEMQLSVWSENFGAQRFYARYGFEKLADIQYRVGEQLDDEFLFAKLL